MTFSQILDKLSAGKYTGTIIPLAAGILIAAIIILCIRKVYGKFVGKLLYLNAGSPESGKTLSELGMDKSKLLKRKLRDGTVLRKTVCASGDGTDTRYYIPENNVPRASALYSSENTPVLLLILALLLFAVTVCAVLRYAPPLVDALKSRF